ncbi:DoxX family protein [uncultured Hydrogenophaga sp.]|uniref:DoxX family protein n=1 Tax=uncultured Hydrogenophaga sp. TaxID=199683 RepID=UPI00258D6CDC|nr:DoxX family protein [uncultured Hydrogenophaga sp.]
MKENEKTLPKWARVALWTVQILLACVFLAAGGAKLVGAQQMIDVFNEVGIGQWFRYFTGAIEVIAGLSLFIPAISGIGALFLACTMVGAVITHMFIIGGSSIGASILLVLCLAVAWLRRDETRTTLGLSSTPS